MDDFKRVEWGPFWALYAISTEACVIGISLGDDDDEDGTNIGFNISLGFLVIGAGITIRRK